jgi:hypothetical protein
LGWEEIRLATICIDESGNFEKNTKTLLIGGLIYHGEDHEEENQRIEDFLKNECHLLGINYPKGIHAKEQRDGASQLRQKLHLKNKIKEYIKSSGKYQFLLMIKPHHYKINTPSNLVNDDVASNLYENMIIQLLTTYLFHNPDKENKKIIHLEIAKRSIPVKITDIDTIKEYESLGYESRLIEYGRERLFYLTSQATFKSVLSHAMNELGLNPEDHFTFHVESINYFKSEKDKNRPTTPFLYLADFACDIIRDTVEGQSYINGELQLNPDFKIKEFIKESRNITGNQLLFWAYDEINTLWKNLFQSFEQKNLIKFLSLSYCLKTSESPFESIYSENWLKNLEIRSQRIFEPNSFYKYVHDFQDYVVKQKKSKSAELLHEAAYVGEAIWKLVEDWEIDNGKFPHQREKYELADSLIRVYNHLGNVERAEVYLEQCKMLAGYVLPDDFFGTILNVSTMYANSFKFEEGLKWSDYNVKKLEEMKQVGPNTFSLQDIPKPAVKTRWPLLGKAYSTMGQIYSFMGECEMALWCYETALEELADNENEQEMTISFLLHLALDMDDKKLYNQYVPRYLKDVNIMRQFDYVSNLEVVYDNFYKIYLFVKSLNKFSVFLTKQEKKEISKYLNDLISLKEPKTVHPWQFIYKHAALWLNNHSKYSLDLKRLKSMIQNTVQEDSQIILRLINLSTDLFLSELYNSENKTLTKVVERFKDISNLDDGVKSYFSELSNIKSVEEQVKYIKGKFRFTYI